MAFVTSADISDKLLLNQVTAADLDLTESFLVDFASSLGVSSVDIVSPTPFRFKQLGIAYASMVRSKFNLGKTIQDQNNGILYDPYETKYNLYLKEVNSIMGSITKDMLVVAPDSLGASDFSMTFNIYRS